jgi:hypothetical protein
METFEETIHDLSWNELLAQVAVIIARDAKSLETNVGYYKKLFNDNNADKAQLNKLFEKLQLDKLRYAYFSELYFRLDESRYKFILMSLENSMQQAIRIQNKQPKDWVATVRFEEGEIKVYFMPLNYF